MGVGLVRSLQPLDILLIYCNNQLKKYITPFSETSEGGTLRPLLMSMSEAFSVPFSLEQNSATQKLLNDQTWWPGPWS